MAKQSNKNVAKPSNESVYTYTDIDSVIYTDTAPSIRSIRFKANDATTPPGGGGGGGGGAPKVPSRSALKNKNEPPPLPSRNIAQ